MYDITQCNAIMMFARFIRPHKLEQYVSNTRPPCIRLCVLIPQDGQNVMQTCNIRHFIEYNKTIVSDGNL